MTAENRTNKHLLFGDIESVVALAIALGTVYFPVGAFIHTLTYFGSFELDTPLFFSVGDYISFGISHAIDVLTHGGMLSVVILLLLSAVIPTHSNRNQETSNEGTMSVCQKWRSVCLKWVDPNAPNLKRLKVAAFPAGCLPLAVLFYMLSDCISETDWHILGPLVAAVIVGLSLGLWFDGAVISGKPRAWRMGTGLIFVFFLLLSWIWVEAKGDGRKFRQSTPNKEFEIKTNHSDFSEKSHYQLGANSSYFFLLPKDKCLERKKPRRKENCVVEVVPKHQVRHVKVEAAAVVVGFR